MPSQHYNKISIRYDNPIIFETPVIEFSNSQSVNKVIYKPADEEAGSQIYTFYLLDNNTVTTDANANGRINGVVQTIQTYGKEDASFDNLKQQAEELMIGDILNHQITLKVVNNSSYNFKLYDKVEYIDEKKRNGKNMVFETYVTRIENNNNIYKVLRLGVLRTTLTDKVKALEKSISTNSKTTTSSGSGSGGAVKSVNGKTGAVILTASDVNALPNSTKYGASIDLSMNSTTYVVTAQLKDQNGNNIGTAKTIDLPLESVVVSGSYDATNKKVVLTLKDGSKVEFSVADLVSGLQSEITTSNKLSVNLISGLSTIATSGKLSDATEDATHRTVTDTEKTTWNNKANKSDVPTEYVKNAIMNYNDDTDELNLYLELSSGRAFETDIPYVREYVKNATVSNNVLKLTNKDGEEVTFEGGSGGSKVIVEVWK